MKGYYHKTISYRKKGWVNSLNIIYFITIILMLLMVQYQSQRHDVRAFIESKIICYTDNVINIISWPVNIINKTYKFFTTYNIFTLTRNYDALLKDNFLLEQQLSTMQKDLKGFSQLEKIVQAKPYKTHQDLIAKKLFLSASRPSIIMATAEFTGDIKSLKNAIVINDVGLIGKVIETSNYDKLLLKIQTVCDSQFRIPIVTSVSGIYAIAKGNSNNCKLEIIYYYGDKRELTEGEAILSAAESALHIPELLIGHVHYVASTPTIIPLNSSDKIEYMKILVPINHIDTHQNETNSKTGNKTP